MGDDEEEGEGRERGFEAKPAIKDLLILIIIITIICIKLLYCH